MSRNAEHVVILTGGELPGGRVHADPPRHQLDLAIERGSGSDRDLRIRHVAEEAWLLGYAEAVKLCRVVAVWVLDDEARAKRFAEFVTREIDPAAAIRASSPIDAVLDAAYPVPEYEVPF